MIDLSALTANTVDSQFQEWKELYQQIQEVEDVKEAKVLHEKFMGKSEDILILSISALVFSGRNVKRMNRHMEEKASGDAFFANILHNVDRKITTQVDAPMAVGIEGTGVVLYINPYRLIDLTSDLKEIVAVLKHECYHLVFQHLIRYQTFIRKKHINRTLMNIATDCQINQLLPELPEGCITLAYVSKLAGKNLPPHAGSDFYIEALLESKFAEELKGKEQQIMDALREQIKQKQQGQGHHGQGSESSEPGQDSESSEQGQDQQGQGSESSGWEQDQQGQDRTQGFQGDLLRDAFDNLTEEEKRQLLDSIQSHDTWDNPEEKGGQDAVNEFVNGIVKSAYNKLTDRQRGTLSNNITQAVESIDKKPAINWKSLVKRGIGTIPVPYRMTKKRMNRRFPERIDLSGRTYDRQVKVVVGVDTSGSVSDEELMYAIAETKNLLKDIKATIDVVMVDTEVNAVYRDVKKSDLVKIKAKGRGGTIFGPFFEYLHENGHRNHDTLAIYFTDGFGESEDRINRYGFNNIYWVLVGDNATENDLSCDGKGRIAMLKDDPKLNAKRLAGR